MRLVLDTNVVVSAVLSRGAAWEILGLARERPELQLFSSFELLAEFADVIGRPFAVQRLAKIGRTAAEVVAEYVAVVTVVEPAAVGRIVPDDADDDVVVATAIAARAMWVVTGDGDLLRMKSHQGISMVATGDARDRLRGVPP